MTTTPTEIVREAIAKRLSWASLHWGTEEVHGDAWPHVAQAAVDGLTEAGLLVDGEPVTDVLVMQSPLTDRWYAVTRWHNEGVEGADDGREVFVADVKYEVTEQVRGIISNHVADALGARDEAERDALDLAHSCSHCSGALNMEAPRHCDQPEAHGGYWISVRHGDHLWTAVTTGRPLNVGGARYERVADLPADPLDLIALRAEQVAEAEAKFKAACVAARPRFSYAEIGKVLGTSRQAAWERISKWVSA